MHSKSSLLFTLFATTNGLGYANKAASFLYLRQMWNGACWKLGGKVTIPTRAVCLSGEIERTKYEGGGDQLPSKKRVNNYTETKICLIGFYPAAKTTHLSDIRGVSGNGPVFQEGVNQGRYNVREAAKIDRRGGARGNCVLAHVSHVNANRINQMEINEVKL